MRWYAGLFVVLFCGSYGYMVAEKNIASPQPKPRGPSEYTKKTEFKLATGPFCQISSSAFPVGCATLSNYQNNPTMCNLASLDPYIQDLCHFLTQNPFCKQPTIPITTTSGVSPRQQNALTESTRCLTSIQQIVSFNQILKEEQKIPKGSQFDEGFGDTKYQKLLDLYDKSSNVTAAWQAVFAFAQGVITKETRGWINNSPFAWNPEQKNLYEELVYLEDFLSGPVAQCQAKPTECQTLLQPAKQCLLGTLKFFHDSYVGMNDINPQLAPKLFAAIKKQRQEHYKNSKAQKIIQVSLPLISKTIALLIEKEKIAAANRFMFDLGQVVRPKGTRLGTKPAEFLSTCERAQRDYPNITESDFTK